jgi:hypothetical protein
VVISASTFGAYGWGLFVMTPLLAGFTTAWFANRHQQLSMGETTGLVLTAGALGCIALLMLALEGLMCIILILPLGTAVAFIGGWLGRAVARLSHDPTGPFVSVAILPLIFMVEAAIPPQISIDAAEHIDIAASPDATWVALTANRPITAPPGLVGRAGLAYAIGSHLSGTSVGAPFFDRHFDRARDNLASGPRTGAARTDPTPSDGGNEPLSPRPCPACRRLFSYRNDPLQPAPAP